MTDFTPELLAQMLGRIVDKQSRAAEVADDALIATTGRVLNFARTSFRALVDELVDDPSGLLHPWRSVEPAEALSFYRRLAHDLGLDFDAIAAEIGSDFEQQRLRDIESGVIVPPKKEPPHDPR